MIEAKKIRFSEAVSGLYKRTQIECNHRQTFLKDLADSIGGYRAAKKILGNKKYLIGIASLKNYNRLDLSVEALVVDPQWEGIFTKRQLEVARERLSQYGFGTNTTELPIATPPMVEAPKPQIPVAEVAPVAALKSSFN
ncbi:MAG: hypothetical protein FD163_511 [Hyphomonadaceae bacterium]|nr:MAG: hypothetical protein FD163_511 [Hyphomonadaceae bacterium]